MPPLDFVLANAFTRSPFGGNPAVTIFLNADPSVESSLSQAEVQDANWMQNVAATLNQPIASFVYPLSKSLVSAEEGTATVGIRWFTTVIEAPLCGHGLLVAAHLLFSGTVTRPDLIPDSAKVDTIRFVTGLSGITVTARRIVHVDEQTGLKCERVEIEMPMATVVPLSELEYERIAGIVANAVGRKLSEKTGPINEGEIRVNFIGKGKEGTENKGFEFYTLIEVECAEGDSLGGLKVDTNILKQTEPFFVNVITSRSSTPSVVYDTRMFAPRAEVHEDHVCGSANCLMAPYWSAKLLEGTMEGIEKEMRVAQVSRRGGELWAIAKKSEEKVLLRGEVKVFAQGQLSM